MGNTIDERVVSMRFDNQQFEKNVQISLGTLSKLKEALRFDKIDMSGITKNIQAITDKVTGMGGIWDTALQRISSKIVDVGQKIGSMVALDPFRDGFKEYETQLDSVQTIMANTGKSVEEVNSSLDVMNTYADKTIYNFQEMASNLGRFTAAGTELKTSQQAIMGISNLAAISGSNSQKASMAMYQLSQAIAAGALKLQDWNSVVNAGMGGKIFQDALQRTAQHMLDANVQVKDAAGNLISYKDAIGGTTTSIKDLITESGTFRESLKEGWITGDVLTETLRQFQMNVETTEDYEKAVKELVDSGYSKEEAKQIADMARTAMDAATKVKTFTQLIDTTKEALGSGWTKTWQLVFGDFEEAKTLWTDVSVVINGFIDGMSDSRNAMLQAWKDMGGRTKLIEGLSNSFKILGNVLKPLKDAITLVFPPLTGKTLADLTTNFANFTAKVEKATRMFPMKLFDSKTKEDSGLFGKAVDAVTSAAPKATKAVDDTKKAAKDLAKEVSNTSKENSKSAEKTVQDFEKVREVVKGVINGDYGNDSARVDALKKAGFDPEYIQKYVDKIHELSGGTWDLSDEMLSSVEKSIGGVEKASKKAKKELTEEEKAAKKSQEAYKRGADASKKTVDEWIKKTAEINKEGNLLTSILASAMSGVIEIVKSGAKIVGAFGAAWRDSFSGVTISVESVQAVAKAFGDFSNKMKLSDSALQSFYNIFKSFFSVFKLVRDSVISFVISSLPTVINVVSSIITTVSHVAQVLGTLLSVVVDFIHRTQIIQTIVSALSAVLRTVGNAISFVAKVLDYFVSKIAAAINFVVTYVRATGLLEAVGARIAQIFTDIGNKFDELKNKLSEKLGFKTFDELKTKLDGVFDSLKKKLLPGFFDLTKALRDFANGGNPLAAIFGKKSEAAAEGSFLTFDEEKNAVNDAKGFFAEAGDSIGYSIGVLRDTIKEKLHPNTDENGNVIQSLVPIDKERLVWYKVLDFFTNVKTQLGNAIQSLHDIIVPGHRNEKGEFIRELVPVDKEKTALGRVMAFLEQAKVTLTTAFSSMKEIIFGKRNEKGELIKNLFPLDKEGGALEKVLGFLNKAAGLLSVGLGKAISGLTTIMSKFGEKQTSAFGKGMASAGNALQGFGQKFKGLKAPTADASSIADKLKTLFGILKDSVLPKVGGLFVGAAKGIGNFIKSLNAQKVLSMAFAIKFLLGIIQGYKLKKALTGTITSIGGFFEGLSNALPGKKEESKTTSMLKIAVAIALVAKSISMIADIPEDRLWSSVGVIAAIAAVLAGLSIALLKIKAAEGSDIKGATGVIVAMGVAMFLIASSIAKIAKFSPQELEAAGFAVFMVIGTLTGAVAALKKVGKLDAATVAGPIAFAIALKLLAKTISFLGKIPDDVFKRGEKNIRKIGLELLIAMAVIGHSNYNAASVAAPITFALAVLALVGIVALVGFIPAILLIKGMIVVKALAKVLTSAMKQLKGIKDPGVAAGPLFLALGILALAFAVVKLGFVDTGKIIKGFIVVGLLGAMLVGFTKLINYAIKDGKIDKSIIITLIAVAGSILVLGLAMALLGKLELGQLLKGIVAVGLLGAIITAIMFFFATFSDGMYIDRSVVAAMIAVVGSIVVLGITAVMLSLIPGPKLFKAVVAIGLLGAVLTACMVFLSLFTDNSVIKPSVIVTLVFLVISINILAMQAAMLSLIPGPKLFKAVFAIGMLGAVITAALIFLSKFAANGIPKTVIASMIVLVWSLTTLANEAALLGIVPLPMLAKGVGVVGLIGLILTVIMQQMSTMGSINPAAVVAPLAIMAGIIGIANEIVILGFMPLDVIIQGGLVVAGIGVVLAGIMLLMAKSAFTAYDVAAPIAVVASIMILANAIIGLGLVPLDIIKQGAAVVGGIGLLLALILAVMGGFDFDIASLLAPLAVVAAVMVLVQAVKMLGEMENSTAGVIGVIALLAALTVALAALSGLAGNILILAASFAMFAAGALMIGAAFNLIADGVMKLVMAMSLLAMIPTQQLATNMLIMLPILALVVAAFIGLAAAVILLSPSLPILLGFSAAILMLGAGLYLAVSAIATFVTIAGDIGGAIANAAGSVAENAPQIGAAIKDALGKAAGFIAANIGPFISKAGELIKGMAKGIADHAPELGAKVKAGLADAGKHIMEHAPEWLAKGKQLLGKLAEGIAANAPKVAAKVKEGLGKAGEFIAKEAPKWLKSGKDLVAGLIKGLGEKAKDIPKSAKDLGKKALDAIKNFLGIKSPSKVFKEVGENTGQGLIDGMDSKSGDVETKSTSWGEKIKSGISDALGGLGAKVASIFGDTKDTVESESSDLADTGSESMTTYADNVGSAMEKAKTAAQNGLSAMVSAISSTVSEWKSAGKKLADGLANGLKTSESKLKSSAKSVSKKAADAVKSTKSKWHDVGEALGEGLGKGIKSKGSYVKGIAEDIISKANAAAKKKAQSHSPSKVWARLGADLDRGLILGMQKLSPNVNRSATSVMSDVIIAAKGPLDSLADLMSSDIVDDPVIKPVMDLSEIQNSSNRLYSMMDDIDRFSLKGNIDLAENTSFSVTSDTNRRRSREDDILTTLIDGLKELRDQRNESRGNTYIIDGITYDDGSNVAAAIDMLVRAAKVGGRA